MRLIRLHTLKDTGCRENSKIYNFLLSQPTGYAVQQSIYDFLTAEEKMYTRNSVQMVDIPDRIRICRHTDFTEMNKFTCNKFTSFTATTASNRFDYTESIVHR